MLVILMDNQILAPTQVCQSCLMADDSGQPRWREGQLRCGQAIHQLTAQQPPQYKCMMGFRVADIE
jgi:conjugal transfer/entry exclusion protein